MSRLPLLLVRFAAFILGGGLLLASAQGLYKQLEFYEVADLATKIERGATLNPSLITSVDVMPSLAGAIEECPYVRAAVTLRIALVSALRRGVDVTLDDRFADERVRALAASLRCFPLDGNLWSQYAAAEMALAGVSEAVLQSLTYSVWTSPREQSVIRGRMALEEALFEGAGREVEGLYRSDVRQVLLYFAERDVALLYKATAKGGRAIFRSELAVIDRERRGRLEGFFATIDSTPPLGGGQGGA